MRQNRRHARRQSIGRVKVSWKADGRGLTEWGMIQDRSEGGLGVRIPKAIKADSIIALVQGFSTMFGVVRHCTRVNGHFFIGVEFCTVEGTAKAPSVSEGGVASSSDRPEETKTETISPAEDGHSATQPKGEEELVGASAGSQPGSSSNTEWKAKRTWE